MRCEVNRELLAETLSVLASALPSRTTYPILQNIRLEVSGGRLAVVGTDLDTFVRKELALEGRSEDGAVVVPGRKLLELAREFAGDRVRLEGKDSSVRLESGGSRAVFSGVDPAEFPELPGLPEGASIELPVAGVLELLELVGFAVSHDDGRPAMCGVNWELSKTDMRMVATDGHRLAFVRRKGSFPASFKAIVAAKALSFVPKGADTMTVYSDPGRLGIVCQDVQVIARPIEGPYPDYERVIPKKSKLSQALLDREPFAAALRRAAVLAHPVGKLVAFEFGAKSVKLRAETPELGSSEEELACEYKGEPMRIGFNAGYMLEMLRHIDSERVAIDLQNPLAAGLLRPHGGGADFELTYLLMPIRLD